MLIKTHSHPSLRGGLALTKLTILCLLSAFLYQDYAINTSQHNDNRGPAAWTSFGLHPVYAIFNSTEYNPLQCYDEPADDLSNTDCRPFKVYNQRQWARMDPDEAVELARYCSCKLVNLNWEYAYDRIEVRRTFQMVLNVLRLEKYKEDYPGQFWSDFDVISNGISIHVSSRDFIQKFRKDPSISYFKKSDFETIDYLRDIRSVCFRVARDELNYYQYMENLQRVQPIMFFKLLEMNAVIDLIYQASKACKLLVVHRLRDFKLRRDHRDFYAINTELLKPKDLQDYNEIDSNNEPTADDAALSHSSLQLVNCKHWQTVALLRGDVNLDSLAHECPMMMDSELPASWLVENPTPSDRSKVALKCGCQLLMLNSSWVQIIKDENIDVMSKTLNRYMSEHKMPEHQHRDNFLWEYFGWFNTIIEKFQKNKKVAVKEMVKYLQKESDPTVEINKLTGHEERALEMLRRGCNRLMFNHIKGSTRSDEIRPIKYLDNLRYISRDPLFVFHLTLQDANLFSLYGLSKMCEPVIA